MARGTVFGIDDLDAQLQRMSRGQIQRIVDAGTQAAIDRMRANTQKARHAPPGKSGRATGAMLGSIEGTEFKEYFGGGSREVYPQGDDSHGVRNATKAYVLNYGRGRALRGDRFITGDEDAAEEAVRQAMQAEADRIAEEIG